MKSREMAVYDCIIADLYMPGLTGFDLLERLHASGKAPPIIAADFLIGRVIYKTK